MHIDFFLLIQSFTYTKHSRYDFLWLHFICIFLWITLMNDTIFETSSLDKI